MSKQKKKKRRSRFLPWLCVTLALMVGSFFVGRWAGIESTRFHGTILLVNESHPLKQDYEPEGLVNLFTQRHSFRLASSEIYLTWETYSAAQEMFAAAEAEDVNGFIITSGYRSWERQQEIYNESEPGLAQKPGCSEHQTGLSFDVTAENSGDGFESTRQYAWLMANCWKYGFIQRYPANKSDITVISYEPWHYRYVGKEAAKAIVESGLTLEEFTAR